MKPKEKKKAVSAQVVLSSIVKQQGTTFKKLGTIKKVTRKNFDEAGALIEKLKDARKLAEEKEADIVEPMRQAIELQKQSIGKVNELFQPFYDKVEEAELRIKSGIKLLVQDSKAKLKQLEDDVSTGKIKNISTYTAKAAALSIESDHVSIRNVWKAFIVDEQKIPREFMMPDSKKITEHLRKGGAPIKGVEWKQDESIAI